jgi:hypothetical protein
LRCGSLNCATIFSRRYVSCGGGAFAAGAVQVSVITSLEVELEAAIEKCGKATDMYPTYVVLLLLLCCAGVCNPICGE